MRASHGFPILMCGLLALTPGVTRAATAKTDPPRRVDAAPADTGRATRSDVADPGMTLRAGQDGTVFRSLTVEGEDRVHFEFERPALAIEMDPATAPGLDWGGARDVLDRTVPDLGAPFLTHSSREVSPHTAHPWLERFPGGAVARFRPELEGVDRWVLTVVDAHGAAVATYQGKGQPPREIAWDGRSQGRSVVPGMTYSYVLVAHDKAGNKRNFVGQGFRVGAWRRVTETGVELVFSGRELPASEVAKWAPGTSARESTPALLIEAASWLNQSPKSATPVKVTVTARSNEDAQMLGGAVSRGIGPMLIGGAARIQVVTDVRPDAPDGGAVRIATGL